MTKTYGRNAVLRELTLDIQEGDSLVIFGPNGAGKTTLLKVLSALIKPDSGRVRILGNRLGEDNNKIRRLVGVVMHSSLLYDELTGYENLFFYAKMFGVPSPKERVHYVVEQMGVTNRLHQKVRTLSHGLQKRFSIARALLHDPPIMLLDEPESGLDQEALAMIERTLVRPQGNRRTVLMTTHNVERGLLWGSKVGIMMNGKITLFDDTKDLKSDRFKEIYLQSTGAIL